MTFTKFAAVKKFVAVKLKYATISDLADDDREDAEVPRLEVVERALPEPRLLLGLVPLGQPDARARRSSASVLTRRSPARSPRCPATLVGIPAVIAWTTSCCVVVVALVDTDVAAEAQDGDPCRDLEDVVEVVRDEDDGEPLVGQPPDELEHLLGLRDAERRGRLVEDDEASSSTCTARATATDCRCPPERVATVWRIDLIVVTANDPCSVSAVRCSIAGSLSRNRKSRISRPRYMFWTTSRLSQSARSWYTTSIPSFAESFGPWMCTSSPSKKISPES